MRDQDVNQIYLNKYLAEQEREDAYQQAVTDKIEEMCQRALTGDDLEEGLHIVTSKSGTMSMAILREYMMKWLDSRADLDARLMCASIEGLMNHARFMDALDNAEKELLK